MHNKFLSRLTLSASVLMALAAPVSSSAEPVAKYPSKLVTLVVPFSPTSGSDIIARVISPKLSERWGQPVIVDNRPGASGNIGANRVATAAPDGYTLLMAINTFTMTPALYKDMPFDPVTGFTPLAKLGEAGYTLAVNPSVPAKDMPSLIAYIRQSNGKASYATPGNGTPQHLAMELLKAQYKLNLLHVPYRGLQGAVTDLIGGQVQMMVSTVNSIREFAQAGKLRMLAVTGQTRNPLAPDVPTFREQGITALDNVDAWYAVMGPPHMPPELAARINRDFIEVMNSPDVKAQLAKLGISVHTSSPDELGTLIKSDLKRWQKVVTYAGISAN